MTTATRPQPRAANGAVQQRYHRALDTFIEKVKQDRYIIAAVLEGSLSYDQVWERSDIDLMLIQRDGKVKHRYYCLTEDGIFIHTHISSRAELKRDLEKSLDGSIAHSCFSKGTLLFSKDESITAWYENAKRHRVASRDRQFQLMRLSGSVVALLTKAEKWYHVKRDCDYAFLWILYAVEVLARIEVVLHSEVPTREVIHQALAHNPEFFKSVYSDLINQKKTRTRIKKALDLIETYLDDKIFDLFGPLLQYLQEADDLRTITELNGHFRKKVQGGVDLACEWLADRDIIQKVSAPLKLTEKSQVEVEEAAFYYDGDDLGW